MEEGTAYRLTAAFACGFAVLATTARTARADFVLGQEFFVELSLWALFWVFVVSYSLAVLARLSLRTIKVGRWFREDRGSPIKVALHCTALAAIPIGLLLLMMLWSGKTRKEVRRKFAEPVSNLGGIRNLEVQYFAEWNKFVGNQPLTPVADRMGNKEGVAWNKDTRFSLLGFAPEGEVFCSYSLEGPNYPTEAQGFTAKAECDIDGNGILARYWITSRDSTIYQSGDRHGEKTRTRYVGE